MILKKNKKDNKYRKLYKKFEINKKYYKYIFHNQLLSPKIRFISYVELIKNMQTRFFSKVKNRCIISGRSRSVLRHFKLSRIQFRSLASNGNITGISRSSF